MRLKENLNDSKSNVLRTNASFVQQKWTLNIKRKKDSIFHVEQN